MTSLLRMPPGVKPTYPVEINWDHPLSKGLVSAVFPQNGEVRDLTGKCTITSTGTQEATIAGMSEILDANGEHIDINRPAIASSGTSSVTFVFGYQRVSTPSNLWARLVCLSNDADWLWFTGDATSLRGYNGWDFTVPDVSDGKARVFAYTNDLGVHRCAIDGISLAVEAAGTGSYWHLGAAVTIRIGDRPSIDRSANGAYPFVWVYNRGLTASELESISRDPYQLLKPAASALNHPALAITTPTTYDDGLRVPDPKWEAPSILVPRVKPTGPIEIDWEAPLAKGLVEWAIISSDFQRLTGTSTSVVDAIGQVESFNGSSDGRELSESDNNYPIVSMYALVRGDAAPNGTDPTSGPVHKANNFNISWHHGNASFRGYMVYQDTGSTFRTVDLNPLSADTWYGIGISISGGMTAYKNGVSVGSAGTLAPKSDVKPTMLGEHANTADKWAGDIAVVFVWDRELTATEHESLHRDPYQFLIPA